MSNNVNAQEYNPRRAFDYLEHLKVQNRRFKKIQAIFISSCEKFIGKKLNTRTSNLIKKDFAQATGGKWSVSLESLNPPEFRLYTGGNILTLCKIETKDDLIVKVNECEFYHSLPSNHVQVCNSFEEYSTWYLKKIKEVEEAIAVLDRVYSETQGQGHHFPNISTYNIVRNVYSGERGFHTWFYEDL